MKNLYTFADGVKTIDLSTVKTIDEFNSITLDAARKRMDSNHIEYDNKCGACGNLYDNPDCQWHPENYMKGVED